MLEEMDAQPPNNLNAPEGNSQYLSHVHYYRSEFHSPRTSPRSTHTEIKHENDYTSYQYIDIDIDTASSANRASSTADSSKETPEISGGSPADHEPTGSIDVDVSSTPQSNWTRRFPHFQGCRLGLLLSIVAAFSVFLVNLIITIWAKRRHGIDPDTNLGTIYKGNCEITKRMSLWLHGVINILSTILLAASNYAIQCLLSPTRKQIDKAHKEGRWLDIGVPMSFKNFIRLSILQKLLWIILWLTSMPLHLLYNSSIFATTSTQGYQVSLVPENTMSSPPPLPSSIPEFSVNETLKGLIQVHASRFNQSWTTFNNPVDCLHTYTNRFPSRYGNVILVINGTDGTNRTVYNNFGVDIDADTTFWLACPQLGLTTYQSLSNAGCGVKRIMRAQKTARDWIFGNMTVKECHVEKRNEECALQYSYVILLTVMICNALKTFAMMNIFIVVIHKSSPLITVGDAIQSFLQDPDRWTKGLCYADQFLFHPSCGTREYPWNSEHLQPKIWKNQKVRWTDSVSAGTWLILIALFLMVFVATSILLCLALGSGEFPGGLDGREIWERGFGELYTDTLIRPNMKLFNFYSAILLANTPQVVLSLVYLVYNSVFTSMMLGEEWNRFGGVTRKTLRVTQPTGAQRSTYWLQLPYRFAVPLMALSGFLHWSTSQTLFFAQLNIKQEYAIRTTSQFGSGTLTTSRVGYSILGILVTMGTGILMVVVIGLVKFRRYPNSMPAIGSCSAAISAACHSNISDREEREKLVLQPLLWGDVGLVSGAGARGDPYVGVRHLSFSDGVVNKPIEFEAYA